MKNPQTDFLLSPLNTYKRRIRLHDGLYLAQKTFWLCAIIIAGLQLIGRIWPIERIDLYSWLIFTIWITVNLFYSLIKPLPYLRVAWRVDQELNLKDRLSTALLLNQHSNKELHGNELYQQMIGLQRVDAHQKINSSSPKEAFKPAWLPRHLIAGLALMLAAAAFAILPNPMDAVIRQRNDVAQAAQEEAENIEDLLEQLSNSDALSEEEKEELLQQLEELADELRQNQGDPAEALADLSQMEQELLDRLDAQADMKQTALESISAQLNALAKQQSSNESLSADIEAALEELAQQLSEMSEAEQQELAQSLQQMAALAAQAGDSALSSALSSLGQAAQAGNSQAAQTAAQQAGEASQQTEASLSAQQALEQALSQLQESQQSIAQAGQGNQTAQGSGNQSSQGNGNGQGQGQGQGSGGGGGSNADSLPPNTSAGQAADPQGEGTSGSVGELTDQVYAPWESQQGENDPLVISGQDLDQGQTQVNEQDQDLPGNINPSTVPYQDVFGTYLDTAYQTVEQSYIPLGLKDYVLEYFTQLEP